MEHTELTCVTVISSNNIDVLTHFFLSNTYEVVRFDTFNYLSAQTITIVTRDNLFSHSLILILSRNSYKIDYLKVV